MRTLGYWSSVGIALALLGGCTADLALQDALPGTWRQADGTEIVFTASDVPIEHADQMFQGRAVTSGGGLKELIQEFRSSCRGVTEIGFLWAVIDQSKYGNVAFYLDPDFSSANSSAACQGNGVSGFEYPVLDSRARHFAIGTPAIDTFGIARQTIETFTAVELDIDNATSTPPARRRNAGAGLEDGARVAFYNAGRSETGLQVLQPESMSVPSDLALASVSAFLSIEAERPRAVWTLADARLSAFPVMFAVLTSEGISSSYALETYEGNGPSGVSIRSTSANEVFSGQAIRFEEVGTCSALGFAACPTPASKVVRIFSVFVLDETSPPSAPRGEQLLTYVAATADIRTAPREDSDLQLWIVQEL